jgi:TRAP-type C4-dicarboxylate transport system permease small subunit
MEADKPCDFMEEDSIMQKSMQMSGNVITTLTKWLWTAGKGFAFFLMCMVFVDVFFRRFKITFVGSKDLTEVAFLILCFFSFSYAWIRGDHINVDIFIEKLPPKFKKMSYVLASMIGVFLLGCLTYASLKLLSDSIQFHSVTPDLKFPHWVMNLAMVLGSGLFTLQCIISIVFTLGIIDKPDLYK